MKIFQTQAARYALLGALFGCSFPAGAILIDLFFLHNLDLTVRNVVMIQSQQPLHWIIDSAPIVLGLLAMFIGRHQDRLATIHQELEREQNLVRGLAKFPEENPHPVLRVAEDGEILYSNRPASELLRNMANGGRLNSQWGEIVIATLKGGDSYEEELVVEDQTMSLVFTPVVDMKYVNIYGRNVTRRVRALEELEIAKEAAEAANRAKSEFLANMSHELRTPMNAILGYAQILESADDLPVQHRNSVETIGESGEHLLSLINNILDISKIEAGREELNELHFDLNNMLHGLASMFEIRCRQQGLTWKLEIAGDLGVVIGDEGKLRQVLINLLGNSIKFTFQGNVTLKVEAPSDELYYFEVSDTGKGIGPEARSYIFEPFHQEGNSFSQGGSGLGLAISRRWGYPFNRSASRPPSVFGRRPPRPVCPWAFQARGMPSPFGRLGGQLPRPSAGNEILETHRLVGHGQLEHAIKHHAAAAGAAAIEAEHELVEVVAHVGTVGGPLMRSQQPPLGQ